MTNIIFILWNDDMRPRDHLAIVGTFASRDDAEAGWALYCESRQYNRDVGTHFSGLYRPHTIDERVVGQAQTVAEEMDDGEFDAPHAMP